VPGRGKVVERLGMGMGMGVGPLAFRFGYMFNYELHNLKAYFRAALKKVLEKV